jgi:myo-inositol 2-dehydrogenase/D-chiro-inositol 1-dehydrogenase
MPAAAQQERKKMPERTNSARRKDVSCSRRRFLAGSAAAAGFAIVEPSLVRGFGANSRIEVGCIGLGGRGRLIAGMLAEHEGFQITSAADYFPQVAQSAGEKLGVAKERCFSGLSAYRKLIAGGVDAVFCETPPCFFPEHVAAAVEAGCHVYLAKPVACDVAGSLKVAAAAKKASKNKQVFLVDFQTRTEPLFIEAIKRTHDGLIGELAMLSSLYADEAFPDPPMTANIESRLRNLIWVNDIAIGGGQIVCADIHAIDVALWIAGARPVSAAGSSRAARRDPHGDSADVYSVTYEFESGLLLNHRGEHLRNTHGFTSACTALGRDGYTQTNYTGEVLIRGNKGGYRGGQTTSLYNDGIKRNLETFRSSIVEGIYDNPTVEPSVNATLAAILGRDAARQNTRLTWDQMIADNGRLELDLSGLKL